MNAIFAAVLKGVTVANPQAWQTGQITATIVGGFILALINIAHAYGCPVIIDAAQANELGAGIIVLVNVFISAATSKHLGVVGTTKESE